MKHSTIATVAATMFIGVVLGAYLDRLRDTNIAARQHTKAPHDHERVKRQWEEQAKADLLYSEKLRFIPDTTVYVNGNGDTTIVITNPR